MAECGFPLVSDFDDNAQWISGATQLADSDAGFLEFRRNVILGRTISVNEGVSKARIRIAALGFYDLYINGARLTSTAITQWTPYKHRIYADSFDLTELLNSGDNRIEIELGNGWRNPLPNKLWNWVNLREYLAVGEPCVKVWIDIVDKDGNCCSILSSTDWEAAEGSVLRNSVYIGEIRDMRLDNDRIWNKVRLVEGASGKIEARVAPPVTARKTHTARSVRYLSKGRWLVDFGENRTGVARVRLRGLAAGEKVSLRQGETVDGDILNTDTSCCGRMADLEQCDEVISAGPREFYYSPRMTFHAFRYMEVNGLASAPRTDDFEQIEESSAVEENGSFECSNDDLNAIHRLCRRTFLNNIMSVQSDCPAREKFGYGADLAASGEAFIHQFGMLEFYLKSIRDNLDEAKDDGWFTETAPFVGIANNGFGGRSGPIGWSMGVPDIAELLVRHYGATEIIGEVYSPMARYASMLIEKHPGYLLPTCIGDHLAVEKVKPAISATAHFVRYLDYLAKFAKQLGKDDEAIDWERHAAKARGAFQKEHTRGGLVGEVVTQGGQVMALHFGLLEKQFEDEAFELLLDDVRSHQSLTTGLQCTKYLLEVLSRRGAWDEVFSIVSRKEQPGWLFMVYSGATTMWETWCNPTPIGHSHDHPMYGHVDAWLKKYMLGIRLADDAVGGDKVVIDPHPMAGVDWAKGSITVAKGTISVEWKKRSDGTLDLSCSLPEGVTRV